MYVPRLLVEATNARSSVWGGCLSGPRRDLQRIPRHCVRLVTFRFPSAVHVRVIGVLAAYPGTL